MFVVCTVLYVWSNVDIQHVYTIMRPAVRKGTIWYVNYVHSMYLSTLTIYNHNLDTIKIEIIIVILP